VARPVGVEDLGGNLFRRLRMSWRVSTRRLIADGLKVSGVYRLYLDLCHELGREPSMVYTGEGVIHESRLEELAEDSGKSKEELLNELEVEI